MAEGEERFQKILDQAHSSAWEGEWEKAAALYQRATQLDPKQPNAWMGLGYSQLELGNLQEAFRAYQQAAQLQPQDAIPLEKLAQIAARLGYNDQATRYAFFAAEIFLKNREVSKALENLIFVTRCKPDEPKARLYLAKLYEKSGQVTQAIQEYLILIAIYQRNHQTAQALQLLSNLQQKYPTRQEIKNAIQSVQQGQFLPLPQTEGKQSGERISRKRSPGDRKTAPEIEIDPISEAHQHALRDLAGLIFELEDQGSTEERRPSWISAGKGLFVKQSDPTKISKHLGAFLTAIKEEQKEQAAGELEKAIQAGLSHPSADFEQGYLRYREDESVIKALQRAAKSPTYTLAANLLMGAAYYHFNRKREAARAFLSALRLADVRTLKAQEAAKIDRLYEQVNEAILSQSDEAIFDKVITGTQDLLLRKDWRSRIEVTRQQLNPQSDTQSDDLHPLGEIFTQSGGYQLIGAMATIQALAKAGHLRSAMEEAYYALDLLPTYLPLHLTMGELLIQMGLMEEAFMKFFSIARSYEIRGEIDQAIRYYRQATDISPLNTTARQKLIQVLIENGHLEDAIQEYIHLGEVYYNLADLRHARESYLQAYQLAQDANLEKHWSVMALHLIGDLDRQNLEWRQALTVYEQLRQIDADDEEARLELVDLNLRLQREPQAVLELDAYLDHLKQKGQTQRAQQFLNRLLADYPDWSILKRRLEGLSSVPRHLR
ncbi:MAG: tetratricopeptide repeat protein [Anaerolineales bacterium]|nr:tetratricopeptide repeat protein [Anaerolineales bacterium]